MTDTTTWAATIRAEWIAVSAAPYAFFGALAVLVVAGWLFWRFWYRHQINNIESDLRSVSGQKDYWKERFDAEHALHEATKKELEGFQPRIEILATEVKAIPKLREMVQRLADGEQFKTQYNPASTPEKSSVKNSTSRFEDISKAAMLANTSLAGVSFTSSMGENGYVTSATPLAAEVIHHINAPREFSNRTPQELLALYRDRTALQADSLMEPYKGLWVRATGLAVAILPTGKRTTAVLNCSGSTVECRFSEAWQTPLSRINNGDAISIVGKIGTTQNGQQLYLQECELEAGASQRP